MNAMSEADWQDESQPNPKPTIEALMAQLEREAAADAPVIGAGIIYALSDIAEPDLRRLEPLWGRLPAAYRQRVLRALNEASETIATLHPREIALLSLDDDSGLVRAAAIDLLWIDESVETMRRLMDMARSDADSDVRAHALAALGRFILLGEYGDIPPEPASQAQALALELCTDRAEPIQVRRRALEALANAEHPAIDRLIQEAYQHGSHLFKLSAIFAMGRTCDAQWQDILLTELAGSDSERVYEAVRACAEIQLAASVPAISELILSDDSEVRDAAIWSLGEIGGKEAVGILTRLSDAVDDEEMAEAVDDALEAASISFLAPGLDWGRLE